MARKLFEEQGIRTSRGKLATGTVFVVYSDAAGTVEADIAATSGGSSITGSSVTVADITGLGPSSLLFYGPDDGTDTLYLRCPAEPTLGVQEIEADTDERLDALESGGTHPNLAVHDTLGLATDAELSAHTADTTAIHGITDTTALATSSSVTSAVSTHAADTDPHGDRAYADAIAQGLDIKAAVQVASTANLTLSGEQTIDGVLTSASRVLVKNQTLPAGNGIYVSAAGAWARATDADTAAEVDAGTFVFVEGGTVNGGTGWAQTTPNPITLGTTALVFSQFSSGGTIIGGAGLVKTGNALDVVAGTGITVAADTIGIAAGGVTNTQVDAAAAIAESKLALNFPTHAENHAARHAAAGADPLTGYITDTSFDLAVFPFTPDAWYDASQITGLADGAAVSTWPDLSGNGRDLTQAAAGSQPSYQTAEQNGLPVVRFDGNSDYMRCSAATWGTALAQPNTIFVVAKMTPSGGTDVLLDGPGGGAGRHLIYNGNATSLSFFAGAQVNAAQTYPMPTSVVSWVVNGASSTARKNRRTSGTGNVGSQALGGLTVGADQSNLSHLNGDVCELLVFDRQLTTYEIQHVESYLSAKWGVVLGSDATDRVLFVSKSGSDTNDGLSWGSAKLTIGAAVTALGGAGTVHIGYGVFTETVDLTNRSSVQLRGTAILLGSATQITPPSTSTSALIMDLSSSCVFDSVVFAGPSTSYTGTLVTMHQAHNNLFTGCAWYNPTNTATDTVGGIGLRMQECEGNLFLKPFFYEFNRALSMVSEATENVFIAMKGAQNYQELVIEGNCGGNTFVFTKWNNPIDSTAYQVDIGGAGSNHFIHPDWSEASGQLTKSRVSSDNNIFDGGAISPQNTMDVTGDYNLFNKFHIQKTLNVTGHDNTFRQVQTTSSGVKINNTGVNNVIDRPALIGGTVTYGTALTPAYRQASGALATNATGGFLYIPTCAGTPTGTPVVETGMVPIVFDTTANKLWVYDGGWIGGTAPGAFS